MTNGPRGVTRPRYDLRPCATAAPQSDHWEAARLLEQGSRRERHDTRHRNPRRHRTRRGPSHGRRRRRRQGCQSRRADRRGLSGASGLRRHRRCLPRCDRSVRRTRRTRRDLQPGSHSVARRAVTTCRPCARTGRWCRAAGGRGRRDSASVRRVGGGNTGRRAVVGHRRGHRRHVVRRHERDVHERPTNGVARPHHGMLGLPVR